MQQISTKSGCCLEIAAHNRVDHFDSFQSFAEPHRRGLQLHCYRMLGSFQDAEDLVQETFLRAWCGVGGFEGRTSFRNWLYRIATNVCLSTLSGRWSAQRVLIGIDEIPHGQSTNAELATENPSSETEHEEPFDRIVDTAPGPDARCEMREAVQLAFLVAIQHLPSRQRAVVLLRDVLGWTAIETARLLQISIASTNSLLQRGRATLEQRLSNGRPARVPASNGSEHALVKRYVRAWDRADIDKFVELLTREAAATQSRRDGGWPAQLAS